MIGNNPGEKGRVVDPKIFLFKNVPLSDSLDLPGKAAVVNI